jgi:hypothetical protein
MPVLASTVSPEVTQPVQRHSVQPGPRAGVRLVVGPPGLECRDPDLAEQVLGRVASCPPGEIRTDRRLMTVDHRHEGVDVAVQRPVYQLRIEAIALLGSTPRS